MLKRMAHFTYGGQRLAYTVHGEGPRVTVLTPGLLLSFTFLLSFGNALNGPAWQAIVPELVPRTEMPAAVSLNSVGFNVARAAGPAIGGLIVAAVGISAGWLRVPGIPATA